MRARVRPLGRPVAEHARHPGTPGSALPVSEGRLDLCALASAPFWARQYTRMFLEDCAGITSEANQTAQLIVSELVTNAVNASAPGLGGPHPGGRDLGGRAPRYSELAGAAVISLSLSEFPDGLLIEVRDSSPDVPVLVHADRYAEHGRGLKLVDALSKKWGHIPAPHGGGKIVYAFMRLR